MFQNVSIQEPVTDAGIAVDATVAQEGPIAAHFIDLVQIYFGTEDLFTIVRRLREDSAERISQK